jgi:hypothetical protein
MAASDLMLHRGAREVRRDELAALPCPDRTKTWAPVGHGRVLETALATLGEAGYSVDKMRLGLSQDNGRFFGTLDLATPLTGDGTVRLAVGVRNSIDKTFPMGFCAGSRVFVCDNLAFRSDLLVRRKHSPNGVAHFSADIANAVMQLTSFKEAETARIAAMIDAAMPDERADSLILRAAIDRGIIPLRLAPQVVREWKEPRHELFQPRTAWSLFNAFTAALGSMQQSNPAELARRTMRLSALLTPPTVVDAPTTALAV